MTKTLRLARKNARHVLLSGSQTLNESRAPCSGMPGMFDAHRLGTEQPGAVHLLSCRKLHTSTRLPRRCTRHLSWISKR